MTMEAKKISSSNNTLKSLVPLSSLSPAHLADLAKKTPFEHVKNGDFIVRLGDRDQKSVYLIEGKVELLDRNMNVVGTLSAGTDMANHPIAHRQPRLLSVRAATPVVLVRVDSGLLDVLLTWDQSSGYDVEELSGGGDEDWLTRLLQSETFRHLPPARIQELMVRMEPVVSVAGETIIRQGDTADYFYIVKSGRLTVTRHVAARGEDVLLGELGEGDCFGEEGLVSGEPRNANVTALGDGLLMRLAKRDFEELLGASPLPTLSFDEAADRVRAGAAWIDVRLPGEFANLHLTDSTNVPMPDIRSRLGEFTAGRLYILCCDTGRRSSAAAFVLRQQGIDVAVLEQGLDSVPLGALTGGEPWLGGAMPEAANDAANAERDARAAELETANAMLLADISELEGKFARQAEELESLRREYASDLDTARKAMARAQEETQNVQRAQSRLHAAVKHAEQRLEDEKRKHEQEVFGLKRELRHANPAGTQAAEFDAQHAKVIAEKDARIAELGAALDAARGETEQLATRHARVLAEREAQYATLQEAAGEQRQAAERELKAATEARERQAAELTEARECATQLEARVRRGETDLAEARDALTRQVAEAERRSQAAAAAAESAVAERDELRKALDAARAETVRERGAREAEHKHLAQLEAEARRLKTECEAAKTALHDAEARAQAAEASRAEAAAAGSAPHDPAPATGADFEEDAEFDVEMRRFQSVLESDSVDEGLEIPALPVREIDDDTDIDALAAAATAPAQTRLLDAGADEAVSAPRRTRLVWYLMVIGLLGAGAFAYMQGMFDAPVPDGSPVSEESPAAATSTNGGDAAPTPGDPSAAAQPAPQDQSASAARSNSSAVPPPAADGAASQDVPPSASIVQAMMRGHSELSPAVREQIVMREQEASAVQDGAGRPESRTETPVPSEPVTKTFPPVKVRRAFSDTLADGGYGPNMVEISGGGFLMGSPSASTYFNERPQREVQIPAFAIGQFEVTFAEYDRFASATGRRQPSDKGWGRATRPVINVTWDDARAYARWLSEQTGYEYRLPTEAEWEYATRAGSATHYWWGNEIGQDGVHANCFGCGSEWDATRTAPVGQFRANAIGLHDVAGNVMEWMEDCYADSYSGAPTDGSAVTAQPCRAHGVRGGGFASAPTALRSAARGDRAPDTRLDDLGFRVVRAR